MPRKPKPARIEVVPDNRKPDVEPDSGGAISDQSDSSGTENENGELGAAGGNAPDAISEPPATERFADPVESAAKRKPGRPRGSTTGATKQPEKTAAVPISFSFVDIIASIHQMAAAGLEVPELLLAPSEAAKLAEACEQVSKFYSVSVDPKKAALFNLFIVAGGIYTSRFMAYRLRMRAESPGQLRVMPTPGVPGPQGTPAGPVGSNGAAAPVPQRPSDIWPQSGVLTDSPM